MTDLDLAGVSRRLDAPEVRLGYLVQALGIILWWVSMAASPWVYQRFEFPGTSRADLFAFLLPDVLLVSVLSLVCWRRPSLIWAAVVWGALTYGALWCVARSLVSGGGWLGTTVMMLATGFNGFLLFGDRWYRRSISGDVRWNLAKTAVQSAGVWVGTLVVIPAAILHASGNWPPRWAGMPGMLGGWAVLLLASAFNIFCGWTMAKLGGGTPFPLDSTTRLVVSGPYRHVRNPMAMAGLTQGLGVAWLVQSWEVLVYVVIGGLVWHGFVRPQEERWLEADFGEAYRAYRREVKCWWPRWNGWGREEK